MYSTRDRARRGTGGGGYWTDLHGLSCALSSTHSVWDPQHLGSRLPIWQESNSSFSAGSPPVARGRARHAAVRQALSRLATHGCGYTHGAAGVFRSSVTSVSALPSNTRRRHSVAVRTRGCGRRAREKKPTWTRPGKGRSWCGRRWGEGGVAEGGG